jgi:predicted Zn-dependent protease with MMP-like domain
VAAAGILVYYRTSEEAPALADTARPPLNSAYPMRRSEFDELVRKAIRRVPAEFRAALDNLEIIVEDWPDPELMEDVSGDRDAVVYGLFSGRALTDRHYDDWGNLPSVIYIYQGPLEEDFPDRRDLVREIEITVVHEIAHYMGIGEERLAEYGYD